MDYKKYSLEQLENWMHDAISSSEATPQEIYDTIKKVVEEQYYYYKDGTSRTNELLTLLNGTVQFNLNDYNSTYFDNMNYSNVDPAGNQIDFVGFGTTNFCYSTDQSEYCKSSWNSFWKNDEVKEDKVKQWVLPVDVDGLSGECYVQFPDDLLEAANLKEGDKVDWVDNNDGSFTLRKSNGTK